MIGNFKAIPWPNLVKQCKVKPTIPILLIRPIDNSVSWAILWRIMLGIMAQFTTKGYKNREAQLKLVSPTPWSKREPPKPEREPTKLNHTITKGLPQSFTVLLSMATSLSLPNFLSFFSPSNPPPKTPVPPPQLSFSTPQAQKYKSLLFSQESDGGHCGSLSTELSSVVCPSLAYSNTLFFKSAYNVQVVVEDNEPEERLLNRFRREVMRAGVIQECKRRRFHENKQEEKKRKVREAHKRNRRRSVLLLFFTNLILLFLLLLLFGWWENLKRRDFDGRII